MASGDPTLVPGTRVTPPKVIGLGARISVWIDFDVAEIPALLDALGDELARHGGSARINVRAIEPAPDVDPGDWRDHLVELRKMLDNVDRGATMRAHGRFDVLWPTVLARGVVHGAVGHAERRLGEARGANRAAARAALDAAEGAAGTSSRSTAAVWTRCGYATARGAIRHATVRALELLAASALTPCPAVPRHDPGLARGDAQST